MGHRGCALAAFSALCFLALSHTLALSRLDGHRRDPVRHGAIDLSGGLVPRWVLFWESLGDDRHCRGLDGGRSLDKFAGLSTSVPETAPLHDGISRSAPTAHYRITSD